MRPARSFWWRRRCAARRNPPPKAQMKRPPGKRRPIFGGGEKPGLLNQRCGLLRLAVVLQRCLRDAAEVEPLEENLLGISRPLDLDVPGAAFVGAIELDEDRLPVGEARAQLVFAEVVVARRIDADE